MGMAVILIITLIAFLSGLLLAYTAQRSQVEGNPVADKIDHLLPQTQCAQCGHPGCYAYAVAIAEDRAEINQCPPGGESLIIELAMLLNRDIKPLDQHYGVYKAPQVAVIDETACVGCTLCISVCPVDAILGASRYLHTVLTPLCTGCELCIAPCPVDCITLQPLYAIDAP